MLFELLELSWLRRSVHVLFVLEAEFAGYRSAGRATGTRAEFQSRASSVEVRF